MSLTGKVAIITGGSKGIGKAAALRLAQEGASVAIGYHSDASGAHEVVEKVGADRAIAVQLNAGKVAEISQFVDQTVEKFGKIDLVIAAAGKMTMSPVEALTEDVFDSLFELNVKGPMFLVQVFPPTPMTPEHKLTSQRKPCLTWLLDPMSSSSLQLCARPRWWLPLMSAMLLARELSSK